MQQKQSAILPSGAQRQLTRGGSSAGSSNGGDEVTNPPLSPIEDLKMEEIMDTS